MPHKGEILIYSIFEMLYQTRLSINGRPKISSNILGKSPPHFETLPLRANERSTASQCKGLLCPRDLETWCNAPCFYERKDSYVLNLTPDVNGTYALRSRLACWVSPVAVLMLSSPPFFPVIQVKLCILFCDCCCAVIQYHSLLSFILCYRPSFISKKGHPSKIRIKDKSIRLSRSPDHFSLQYDGKDGGQVAMAEIRPNSVLDSSAPLHGILNRCPCVFRPILPRSVSLFLPPIL